MLVKKLFTIIIPVHNGSSTIKKTLNSIINQKDIVLIKKIIIINDGSRDNSLSEISKFNNKIDIKIINHQKSIGLAASLNQAIKISNTKYVILCHQDITIKSTFAFTKFKKIISQNPQVFYIYPLIYHPKSIWNKYNFWQKCLFSRYTGSVYSAPIEKFDCVDRQQLINIGLFDNQHFRTAGEDLDLIIRAQEKKLNYLPSNIKIIHIHNQNPNFSFKDLIRKENQLAETKGVLLRIHGFKTPNLKSFFREIIFLLIIIPQFSYFGLLLLIAYLLSYNWKLYFINDKKKFLLPIINLYLFVNNIISSTKAFIQKKQNI